MTEVGDDRLAARSVRIHHLKCGHGTQAVTTCVHCGRELTADNTTRLPGPGGRIGPGTRVIGPLIAARES